MSSGATLGLPLDLTWEQITADGIITMEEIEDGLRAKWVDPYALDYLYE